MKKRKATDLSLYFTSKEELISIINSDAEIVLKLGEPTAENRSWSINFGLLNPGWGQSVSEEKKKAFRKEYFKFLSRFERETGIGEITRRMLFKSREDWDINELRGEANVLIKAYEIRKGKTWIELLKEHMLEGWGIQQEQQETPA